MFLDVSRALRTIRARAADWSVDPRRIGILCYPVITIGPDTHAGSRLNLLGPNPSPALVTLLSNELQVTSATPPCFLFHTWEDNVVKVENTLAFAAALRAHGIPFASTGSSSTSSQNSSSRNMPNLALAIAVIGVASPVVCLADNDMGNGNGVWPSPDKHYTITQELLPLDRKLNEAPLVSTLFYNGHLLWKSELISRGFDFSWAPDSSGFLMGITHISRSMTLDYVAIDGNADVYATSLGLETIKDSVQAHLADIGGASAPKSGIDWDTVKWTSPHTCRMVFYQRFLGRNADSILELNVENPFIPKLTVISSKQLPKK